MLTRLIAKAFVFNERDEMLLLRRSQTDQIRPGGWDIPGGGVELGEDTASAVCREIFEETHLTVKPEQVRLRYAVTTIDNEENAIRFCFVANVTDPEVRLNHEHDSYRWANLDDVFALYDHRLWATALRYLLTHKLLDVTTS